MESRNVRLNWRVMPSLAIAARQALRKPGVYVLGEHRRSSGLITKLRWRYVGKSNDLRRRICEHQPSVEAQPQLRAWLKKCELNRTIIEVWCAETQARYAKKVESDLISGLLADGHELLNISENP